MFIVTDSSHIDHAIPADLIHWASLETRNLEGFFIRTLDLPEKFPPVECGLRGPTVGDAPVPESEVVYAVRKGRTCASRIAQGMPKILSRKLTVIAGPNREGVQILYTVYGGPAAPREPGDPTIATIDEIGTSRAFWAEHALVDL